MEKILIKYIRQCNEEFLNDNPMDGVDVNIVDNYTDYIVERLEMLFEKLRNVK